MQNLILHSLSEEDLKKIIQECMVETLHGHIDQVKTSNIQKVDSELIRLSDVAMMFGVSKVTIHTWKKKGLLPFYRISNKIYFKKAEVLASLKSPKRKSF